MIRPPFIFQAIRCYVQGPGILHETGTYISRLGGNSRTCVLIDRPILALAERIQESLTAAGIESFVVELDGDTRQQSVERLTESVRGKPLPGVVLGVGGGKAIDVAKIVARGLGARCAICATSSSTDAAPSHTAVLLDERDQINAETLERNPDLVMVDSELIASAPVRLFVAGIGDAISKKYEMEAAVRLGESNAFGGRPVFFVSGMADTLQECLLRDGVEAKRCVARGELNEAVERVITACVLLSTLVWENGGLAGAHSIANVFANAGHAARNLHGELVAFGLLVFLALEGQDEERMKLDGFFQRIGLPRKISHLGIRLEDETVDELCREVHERYRKHALPHSAEAIHHAIELLQAGSP